MIWRALLFLCLAYPAGAETIVAARTIRAHAIILPTDVTLSTAQMANGFGQAADVVGQEARVVLYAGRPILIDDIGPPAIVTRNQLVRVVFQGAGLSIATEARALERGAAGDRIRIMNLSSRATLFGQIQDDGTIKVHR
ncbi:flagellar basal body P-ring formation chaperone FlgA [Sulfitobacter aestuariivivens]|uniref:Flagella basal body P-ring formation protein FlgA n=1 Tax=Sulfitobacter aestuariivivens TaxID=2766981 RepID=A0A927D5H7_9RHOB|nr:flagellar basal body P-ring formation chaperone FlgA [Sulfitobacter aestuariivivens]MBD3665508.1 flagellar basal body P-ring formation protein FlgA [Sulfitobacter aestuariivivens]